MDPKEQAGRKAAEYVKNGMVVGLGTGSTAEWAIRALAARVKEGQVADIQCIPTSSTTRQLADELGLSIRGLEDVEWVDLTIDGADQVDDNLNLIKGAGGALLREKVVAFSSGEVIIIVDETKLAKNLGGDVPVPVEVIPFAEAVVRSALTNLGAEVEIRMDADGDDPYITDNDNLILDCKFLKPFDPKHMEREMKRIPGVVENGLFVDMTDRAVVGQVSGAPKVIDAV
jgi:ribose 5-phosphate isomerase A